MSIELAKRYLEKRALDTSKKGVKKMLREGTIYSVIPTNEVLAVLSMVSKRTLKTFIKKYNQNQHRLEDVV